MRRTILLVEDETNIRHLMRRWLEHLGYEVYDAPDGKRGWELVQEHMPELVMTDIAMPEMDGVELCRLIKLTDKTSGIPVLVFTSYSETESQLAGAEAGADAYLSKETDLRVLQARIEALLKARLRQSEATRREVASVRRQTLSQSVTTLAHYINNSVMAIHATAGVIDPTKPDQAEKLQRVCQAEARKILVVLRALKRMAEEEDLKTTVYVGHETMFDLEAELARLSAAMAKPGGDTSGTGESSR